ncbi:MAG: protein kinase domain-containing protein [Spirochaetota bacterium]
MGRDLTPGELIARGASTDIFATRDAPDLVMKVLHPHLASDPIVRARFSREAEQLSQIHHPAIVEVVDLVSWAGRPAMLLERARGGTLEDRRLAPAELTRLARSLLDGLACVHDRGIVHRDIRPSHVLFRRDDEPLLVDFGMASVRDLSGLTRSTVYTSHPYYADPHAWGRERHDACEDLYGLGAVLFEALTGERPPSALFGRDATARTAVREHLDRTTDHFITTLIALLLEHPDRRPRTAREVIGWIDAGDVHGARRLTECLFCGAAMPADSLICLSCGRAPLQVRRDPAGEFLVLTKISERDEVLAPFLRKLELVSARAFPLPHLLTGDVRLYSRAERTAGVKLPVRVVEGIASESVEALIKALEGRTPTEIHLERRPMRQLRRFRRGPLITLREGRAVAPATLEALRRLMPPRSVAGSSPDASPAPGARGSSMARGLHRDAALRRGSLREEASYAIALAASRIAGRPDAEDLLADSIDRLRAAFAAAIDRLETAERYLSSVSLHSAYADLERAAVCSDTDARERFESAPAESTSARSETADRAARIFDAYAATEREAAALQHAIVEACRRLEATHAHRFAEDIAEIISAIQDRANPSA